MSQKPSRRPSLTRQDWIEAARRRLISSGVNAIKIDGLAGDLGATRGSFYWHFADHAELLHALLASWVEHNTRPFRRVLDQNEDQPLIQLLRYAEVWLDGEFNADYDAAIRDWGRISETVAESVRRTDEERLAILFGMFERLGFDRLEALVRARTFYYHQIGYFALRVVQPIEERLQLLPTYFRVLTGCPMPRIMRRDAARAIRSLAGDGPPARELGSL